MQAQLVVLDMAGTTVFDGDAVHRCVIATLRGMSVDVTRDEVNDVMGWPKAAALRHLLQRHAGDGAEVPTSKVMSAYDDFVGRMLAHYRDAADIREIDGASRVLEELKEAGARIVLDTGFSRAIAGVILERLGWMESGLVDEFITSDDVPRGRPYPDMIFKAMELMRVSDAGRVAKVGDTPSDLQEGDAAGCGWVIGVTSGSHTRAQLLDYQHTHIIDSVNELPDLLRDKQERSIPVVSVATA